MAERTFESQMARLEEIVRLLERGEAPLNESMKLFEEGTKLSASLGKLLDKAEQKVTVMQENMQGELAEQPFAAEEEAKFLTLVRECGILNFTCVVTLFCVRYLGLSENKVQFLEKHGRCAGRKMGRLGRCDRMGRGYGAV